MVELVTIHRSFLVTKMMYTKYIVYFIFFNWIKHEDNVLSSLYVTCFYLTSQSKLFLPLCEHVSFLFLTYSSSTLLLLVRLHFIVIIPLLKYMQLYYHSRFSLLCIFRINYEVSKCICGNYLLELLAHSYFSEKNQMKVPVADISFRTAWWRVYFGSLDRRYIETTIKDLPAPPTPAARPDDKSSSYFNTKVGQLRQCNHVRTPSYFT